MTAVNTLNAWSFRQSYVKLAFFMNPNNKFNIPLTYYHPASHLFLPRGINLHSISGILHPVKVRIIMLQWKIPFFISLKTQKCGIL